MAQTAISSKVGRKGRLEDRVLMTMDPSRIGLFLDLFDDDDNVLHRNMD